MADYRKSEIVSGLFIILAVSVFTLFAFKVGGLDLFAWARPDSKRFTTLLANIRTLEPGSKVTYGGFRVGQVTEIRVATAEDFASVTKLVEGSGWKGPAGLGDPYPAARPARVWVEFEVSADAFPKGRDLILRENRSRVLLQQEGFIGPYFLQIDAGPATGDGAARSVFEDDGWGTEDNPIFLVGQETGLLQELFAKVDPLVAEFTILARRVNEQLLSDANLAALGRMITDLEATLADAKTLMAGLAPLGSTGPEGLSARILDPLGKLIADADTSLNSLTKQLEEKVLDEVQGLIGSGEAAVADARKIMASLNGAVDDANPKMQKILDDLSVTTGNLETRLNEVQGRVVKLMTKVEVLVDNANGTVVENRAELSETFQSLRRAMWEAEMALRKVRSNPAVVLWGDDEKTLGTLPTDPSGRRRSGRAPPYGQREENDGRE